MKSKFATINGYDSVPIFCARLTEIADEIESIACVVKYKDDSAEVFHTAMPNVDVTWLKWVFDQDFHPEMEEEL